MYRFKNDKSHKSFFTFMVLVSSGTFLSGMMEIPVNSGLVDVDRQQNESDSQLLTLIEPTLQQSEATQTPMLCTSFSGSSGRHSPITQIQQKEQELYNLSPHETQFQSPDILRQEKKYSNPTIISNPYDEFSCGAATVHMALKILYQQGVIEKTEVPTFGELVDILQIKKRKYADIYAIKKYLSDVLHLHCALIIKPIKKTKIINGLDAIIENSRTIPAIAFLSDHYDPKNPFGHFALVWDTNEDPYFVTICDPWETDKPVSYIPKQAFCQTCVAIIQVNGRKKSYKPTKLVEKKQTLPHPATSIKDSEIVRPQSGSRFALLSEAGT